MKAFLILLLGLAVSVLVLFSVNQTKTDVLGTSPAKAAPINQATSGISLAAAKKESKPQLGLSSLPTNPTLTGNTSLVVTSLTNRAVPIPTVQTPAEQTEGRFTNSCIVDQLFGYKVEFPPFPAGSALRSMVCKAFSPVPVEQGPHSVLTLIYKIRMDRAVEDAKSNARQDRFQLTKTVPLEKLGVAKTGTVLVFRDADQPSENEALMVALTQGSSMVLRLNVGVAGPLAERDPDFVDVLKQLSFFDTPTQANVEFEKLLKSGNSGYLDNTYGFVVRFPKWAKPTPGISPKPWSILGPPTSAGPNPVITITPVAGKDDGRLFDPENFQRALQEMGHSLMSPATVLKLSGGMAVGCSTKVLRGNATFVNWEGLFGTADFILDVGAGVPVEVSSQYGSWPKAVILGVTLLQ